MKVTTYIVAFIIVMIGIIFAILESSSEFNTQRPIFIVTNVESISNDSLYKYKIEGINNVGYFYFVDSPNKYLKGDTLILNRSHE